MKNDFNYENIALNGVSMYNLGYSLEEVKKRIEKSFNIKVSFETIESWLSEYGNVCSYLKIREEALSSYSSGNVVFSKNFYHNQVYKFQYHRAKLSIEEKNGDREIVSSLKKYFEWIAEERKTCLENNKRFSFPHNIFKSRDLGQRASKAKIKGNILFKAKEEKPLCQFVYYALMMAKNNYERHKAVQDFMVLNDSLTLASEVPVYLNSEDLKDLEDRGLSFNFDVNCPVTGHIDLVRIKKGKAYVLDYKPNALKEKPLSQLIFYSLALSLRTKMSLKNIRCAWFDEKNYFEFSPSEAIFGGKQKSLMFEKNKKSR